MKKLLFKMFAVGLLLVGGGRATLSATQYCREAVTATAGEQVSLKFSAEKTGDLQTTFTLTSDATTFSITRNSEKKLYETLIQNTGGGVLAEGMPDQNSFYNEWTYDAASNTLTLVVNWSTYPTGNLQLHVVAYRDASQSGSDITGYTFTDIDVSEACPSETPDTTKPVMGTATLVSASGDRAVVSVAATDKDGDGRDATVKTYHVVDDTNSVDQNVIVSDGKIVVTSLTVGTTYNFTITAIDAAGNESENSASVSATTAARYDAPQVAAPTPTVDADKVVSIYSDAYTSAVNNGGQGTRGEVDGNEYYMQNGEWFFWHTNNPKEGKGSGAVDISRCNRVHIDMWIADNSVTVVKGIRVQGEGFSSTNIPFVFEKDQEWVSLDLPLSDFYNTTFTSTAQQVQAFCFSYDGCAAAGYSNEQLVRQIYFDNIYFYNDGTLASDETKPVMGAASVFQYHNTSALINVAATDKNDNNEDGVVASYKIGENTYVPSDGRISVTGLTASTAQNLQIYAVDAYGNVSENYATVSFTTRGENLALNKTATAGKVAGDGFVASYAVNGNVDDRWASGEGATVEEDWIAVDLGAQYALDIMMVNWEGAHPANYVIEYSSDGTSWETALTESTLAIASQTVAAEYDLTGVTAQHVRIRTLNDVGGAYMNYGISIWEIEVYGATSTNETAPTIDLAEVSAATGTTLTVKAQATDDEAGTTITYKVKNGDEVVATATGTSGAEVEIVVKGLTVNTDYTFTLTATDPAGNVATSESFSGKTRAADQYCEKTVSVGAGSVLVTIQKADDTHVDVLVGDPNTTYSIDFVNVIVNGVGQSQGTAGDRQKATGYLMTFSVNDMSSFKVQVLWHPIGHAGGTDARETTGELTVTEAELCDDENGLRTSVEEQAAVLLPIVADNGMLRISLSEAQPVQVYSVAGQQLYSRTASSVELPLARGIYMVRVGGRSAKVVVR